MRVKLWSRDDEVEVWAYLEDGEEPDPATWTEAFILGTGATAADALTDAERELDAVSQALGDLRD